MKRSYELSTLDSKDLAEELKNTKLLLVEAVKYFEKLKLYKNEILDIIQDRYNTKYVTKH